MTTVKMVRDALRPDTASRRDGVFTVRWGFFFRHGGTAEGRAERVKKAFPTAVILDSGEVWKRFSGGASTANQSHWFVKFSVPN